MGGCGDDECECGNDVGGCGDDVMRREWVGRKGAGTQSHCRRTSPRCSEWVERKGAGAQRSLWWGEVGWGRVSGCGTRSVDVL